MANEVSPETDPKPDTTPASTEGEATPPANPEPEADPEPKPEPKADPNEEFRTILTSLSKKVDDIVTTVGSIVINQTTPSTNISTALSDPYDINKMDLSTGPKEQ